MRRLWEPRRRSSKQNPGSSWPASSETQQPHQNTSSGELKGQKRELTWPAFSETQQPRQNTFSGELKVKWHKVMLTYLLKDTTAAPEYIFRWVKGQRHKIMLTAGTQQQHQNTFSGGLKGKWHKLMLTCLLRDVTSAPQWWVKGKVAHGHVDLSP